MPTRPRVLLVEDHPAVRKLLVRLLSQGCDVVDVIADGREVADAATRLQPVVIVMDLNLPGANGLDVCRKITQENPDAKIVVITAMADDAIRDEVLAAGASSFVHKSSLSELTVAIRRLWTETA